MSIGMAMNCCCQTFVKEMYAKRKEELKAIVAERHAEENAWAAATLKRLLNKKIGSTM